MTEAILLGVVAAALIGVLYLIGYATRRSRAQQGEATVFVDLAAGSSEAGHSHISHSHVDCSAHSVDCGGHGGH